MDELEGMIRSVIMDEESEAAAYYRLASLAEAEDVKRTLLSIAEDSVVHAEVMRGILAALRRIRGMRREFKPAEGSLLEELKAHLSIEILAGAMYDDLKRRADVGSMRAVIEAIEREEKKHERLVRNILERISA